MRIEMYVLCLLRFQGGEIVFKNDRLKVIKDSINKGLQSLPNQNLCIVDSRKSGDVFKVFKVHVLNLQSVGGCLSPDVTIKSAEIGYYHHRVIAYLELDSAADFSTLREVRNQLKQPVYEIIERGVKEQINELVCAGELKLEARVEFLYTYPLIVVEKRPKRSESFPFSEETGSLCFDIVEPSWVPPLGKKHMMRISIPGTVLYTQGKVGNDLVRDVINAIYQYCLYEQRSMDKWPFENLLDESLLVRLWTHITDCMGGRSVDVHIIRLTHTSRFLALLAIIISIISLVISLILRSCNAPTQGLGPL